MPKLLSLAQIRRSLDRRISEISPYLRRHLGEQELYARYRRQFGRPLDVANPATFTEKLFAAMVLNNRQPDQCLTELTDKLLVRRYVAERIGSDFLVKILWSGFDPSDIPFESLPALCVAKTNHGCGNVLVLNGEQSGSDVVSRLKEWLSKNYYFRAREAQYYSIDRRVYVEEYVGYELMDGLVTFRCWCFQGKVEIIQVDGSTRGKTAFYDLNWAPLDLQYRTGQSHRDFACPDTFDTLLEAASRLAAGFAFVRVDMYVVGSRIYFNEMTFTPAAGNMVFDPPGWDRILGEKWL